MTELDVRIVRLEPMRVASAHGFGETPEDVATQKILSWAKGRKLVERPYRWFGFNNPNPSPGSPNYGYETWITVGPDVEPEGDIRVQEFFGGLYAVTRCKGLQNIGKVWKQLVTWREDSKYKKAYHQWMEELLEPHQKWLRDEVDPNDTPFDEFVLDLYLPIAE